MASKIRMKKQVSALNLRSHSISTFNRYDWRISQQSRALLNCSCPFRWQSFCEASRALSEGMHTTGVRGPRGHRDVIVWSAPVHATLAQPAAGADALKDLRAQRAPAASR